MVGSRSIHAPRLDPALPELSLVLDVEAVARRFERVRRSATGTKLAIAACKRRDTSYEPGARCTAVYELSGTAPGGANVHTIGVLEITRSGIAQRWFQEDPALPRLTEAIDEAAMTKRLAEVVGAEGQSVVACRITPVRYKPARSCVLRYDVGTPAGERVLFGKLVAGHGDELASTVAALHEASRFTPLMPRIPRPVAYWPDLQLLAQPAVANGVDLSTQIFGTSTAIAERAKWMDAAGEALAAFHASVTVAGPRRTIESDLREVRGYRGPLAQVLPDLAQPFDRALAAVSELAAGHPEPAPVASHGALRTDQLLIDGSRLAAIDLDGFCWANPARDVGNMLAYLDWKAIRVPEHAALAERAQSAFLAGYENAGRPVAEQWLRAYRAVSMLKITGRRVRGLSVDEWPLLPRLLDTASASL